MTPDRLREAADRLDEMAVELERMHITVAANPAALLRAVADRNVRHNDRHRLALIYRAANNLADAILGGTDE